MRSEINNKNWKHLEPPKAVTLLASYYMPQWQLLCTNGARAPFLRE